MKPILVTAAITILVGSMVSRQGNGVYSHLDQPQPTGVGLSWIANNTALCNVSGENALPSAGALAPLLPGCIPVSSGIARKYLGADGPIQFLEEQIVADTFALQALSGMPNGFVARRGDVDASYTFSTTDCSLNSGTGDRGSQIPPTSGGGCWNLPPDTDANPKIWGVVGDGATDDTAAAQKAINYLSAGGKLSFPPGTYCIRTGPLTLTVAGITLQGRNYGGGSLGAASPAVLSACGADVSIVNMSGKGDRLEDFRVLGSNAVGTTHPAVMLTGGVSGCNECTIRNSYIQLGSNAVYADAYEVYLEGMAADTGYGGAVVHLVNTGGHIGRSKFDQAYPAQAHGWTPRHGISITSWSAGTAYAQNTLVVVGSYLLQAMNNGTSGGAQPTVQPYGANITDGSITWQLVGPTTYYGVQCDTGCGWVLTIDTDTDFSSVFSNPIALTNTLGGNAPGGVQLAQITLGSNRDGIVAGIGSDLQVTDVYFGSCLLATCSGVSVYGSFSGNLQVRGGSFANAATGVFIGAGTGNSVVGATFGSTTTPISVGAGVSDFTLDSNVVGKSRWGANTNPIYIAPGSSDRYVVQGNNCFGATNPISDRGTGTHKSVQSCPN